MGNVRDYRWSSIFAWGLTLSGAAMATGGVIGMFWPTLDITWLCVAAFAGMMAFGIGLVNCSAAGALQAIKHRKPGGKQVDWTVLAPALACCLGFAFATNIGVHMGWEVVKANAPAGAHLPPAATIDLVFYIFAFAKPAMAWIVEGRKAMDAEAEAERLAQRKREQAEASAAETARLAAMAKRPKSVREPVRAAAERAARTKPAKPAAKSKAKAEEKREAPQPLTYGKVDAAQVERAKAAIRDRLQPIRDASVEPAVEKIVEVLAQRGQAAMGETLIEALNAASSRPESPAREDAPAKPGKIARVA